MSTEKNWVDNHVQFVNGLANSDYNLKQEKFIEDVFEIAFGDNAINREFSYEEVLNVLRDNSDYVTNLKCEA